MKPKRRGVYPRTKWKNSKRQITKGALARKFILSGTPSIQIAKQLGINKDKVNQIKKELKDAGFKIPEYKKTKWKTEKGKTFKTSQAIKAVITSPTKKTRQEYAQQLNITKSTVDSAIKQIERDNQKLIRQGLKPFKIQQKLKPSKIQTKKSKKEQDQITKFILGGTPNIQIAKQTGLSESRISQIKKELIKAGFKIPKYKKTQWKNSKGRILKRNQVRKAIIESPTKKTRQEYAQELNITKLTVDSAIKQIERDNQKLIRQGLKPFKIQTKSGMTKPIPKLTQKQKKLLDSIQPIIKQTINKTAGKFKLNPDEITDLNQQTQIKMHRWIHKHNPTKIGRPIIRLIINNQTADFNRLREQQQTGLSRIETIIGRKIEAFKAKETNRIQHEKKRKILPEEEQQILEQAIQTVNNTPAYAKEMKIQGRKFHQKKLTLTEAQKILNARTTAKKQKNTHDRNEN